MSASPAPRPLPVRLGALVLLTLGLIGAMVLPALAHGGVQPQPVVTDVPNGIRGLEAQGVVAYAQRIRVTNGDDEVLTVTDDSGRPWLEISEAGVFADLTVRRWYESLDSTGRGIDPPADAPTGWTKVSTQTTWEWFDTDMLPRLDADDDHTWTIPVVAGGELGQIEGTLVESELQGQWSTNLVSDPNVGPARLTAVSGTVPIFVIQLLDAEEVVVLGRDDEPMVRLTAAGYESNMASPTWGDHGRLDTDVPVGTVVEDPTAEPVWDMRIAGAPVATWLDTRGTLGQVVPQSRKDLILDFTIPIMVDGTRYDVVAQSTWVGDVPPVFGFRLTVPGLIGLSLGAGLIAAAAVRAFENRGSKNDAGEVDTDAVTGVETDEVDGEAVTDEDAADPTSTE